MRKNRTPPAFLLLYPPSSSRAITKPLQRSHEAKQWTAVDSLPVSPPMCRRRRNTCFIFLPHPALPFKILSYMSKVSGGGEALVCNKTEEERDKKYESEWDQNVEDCIGKYCSLATSIDSHQLFPICWVVLCFSLFLCVLLPSRLSSPDMQRHWPINQLEMSQVDIFLTSDLLWPCE